MKTEEEVLKYFMDFLVKGKTHANYTRTVTLAKKYYAMVTGDGLNDMLQRIVTRETEEMFKQRVNITKHAIPSILNGVKMPYYKASRKQPIVRKIDWKDKYTDEVKLQMEDAIATYWGSKALEEFMEWAYVDYSFIDPNAFILTDFEQFDSKVEKAKPYPVIISSSQAVDYLYKNEILQYLSIKLPVKYIENGVEVEGSQFTVFTGKYTYQFTQVAFNTISLDGEIIISTDKEKYLYRVFEPNSEVVPAHRIGYINDYTTQGQTYVSVFHCAIPILEKTLKINSELDLSTAMVAFPQRFAYTQPCTNQGCYKGEMSDGTTCPVCKGTGVQPHHGSTADVMELPLPKSKEDMLDLSNLLHYVSPPIELLKFQDEYIEKCKRWVYSTVFNSDTFTRAEITSTATEKILEVENLNDTLYPFARKYSQLWVEITTDIATFIELSKGIILQHKFPMDFKFKTVTELMNDLKAAKDSGASSATVAAIEDDINEILYTDRPDELQKIKIKNSFNPFRGYDQQRLAIAINTNKTPKYYETLYLNLENIFQELEAEMKDTWIYDLPMAVIEDLVKKKVEERMKSLEGEAPKPATTFSNFNQE